MFCTKIFNWGKGKKEGASGNKTAKTLDTVYPEPQDEGELCPYWTHIQCQQSQLGTAVGPHFSRAQSPSSASLTSSAPPSPYPPPIPYHHDGFYQPTATVKSPSAIRRGYHHSYRAHHDGTFHSPHYTSPFHSPVQSPIHHSHGRQSPLVSGHGRQSPLCQSRMPNSPSSSIPNTQVYSPAKQSLVSATGSSHSSLGYPQSHHASRSGSQSSLHHSGSSQSSLHKMGVSVQSPLHHSGSSQGSLYRISNTQPQSPKHSCSAPQSPRHLGNTPQSPVPKGYIVEDTYSQPLSPQTHPPPPPQRPPPPIPEEEGKMVLLHSFNFFYFGSHT